MKEEIIELLVDGQKVKAHFFKPTKANKKLALLFVHGWTGRPNTLAGMEMAKNGYPCLTIIMRGHEGSDGDIKQIKAADSLSDAAAGYDFLKAHIPEGTQIATVGNSYGAYIALMLSTKKKLAAISLRVPAAYRDQDINITKWNNGHDNPSVDGWRHTPTNYKENIAFKALHDFAGPIQVLEGELDEVIPHQTVQNYVNAVSDRLHLDYQLMRGWPHSIGKNAQIQKEFEDVLLKWVNNVERAL